MVDMTRATAAKVLSERIPRRRRRLGPRDRGEDMGNLAGVKRIAPLESSRFRNVTKCPKKQQATLYVRSVVRGTRSASDLRIPSCGPELVSVVDDPRVSFLAQFPERRLDLHPNHDVFRLDINQLGRHADALVHLDDRYDLRFLHCEIGGRVVDHRIRVAGYFAYVLYHLT